MENASKALLIAAGVLIVILIITIGIRIMGSQDETISQADTVGKSISDKSKDAVSKIDSIFLAMNPEENVEEYDIIISGDNSFRSDINNPDTIKKNETVILKFEANTGLSSTNWSYNISGATFDIIEEDNMELEIKLSNPTQKVELRIEAVGCCFVSGTKVLMHDGTTKKIEDIKIGEKVLTYNESTKKYETGNVTNLITNPNTTNIARVTLIDGTSIEMNEYHPICTEEGWKSLINYNNLPSLTKDDKVLSNNGKFIQIKTINCWKEEKPITTYNLTVETNHNYFVGETPILVHNADCPV